jgi:D-alanyl-D-alanine dipeptidase
VIVILSGARRSRRIPRLSLEFSLSRTSLTDCEVPRSARDVRRKRSLVLLGRLFVIALFTFRAPVAGAEPRYDNLVDLKSVDPMIVVELRYATRRNITGHALYPPDLPALVRPTTAARLAKAQAFLRARHYGLKIWDAYRPLAAQMELWQRTHDGAFVADPYDGNGSLHTWGVAVDATLVDENGREVAMPTKYDEFSPAAKLRYQGNDPVVKSHLKILQAAMRHGGFYGMHTEWWHFVAYDWKKYAPMREAKKLGGSAVVE